MKANSGMTIIEVLIALALLGLTLSILTTSMISNANLNDTIDKRGQAIRLSEQILESYRSNNDYTELSNPNVIQKDVNFNGFKFPVKTTFCPTDAPKEMPCTDSAVFIRVEIMNNNKVLHKTESYFAEFGGQK